MGDEQAKAKKGGCCFTIVGLGLALWLGLWTYKPAFTLEQFKVSALNKTAYPITTTAGTATNRTIYFELKIKNRNFNKRVYYDALNITFYYEPAGPTGRRSSDAVEVGHAAFPPFKQGFRESTHRTDTVDASGVDWEKASEADGLPFFRVDLATAVRHTRMYFWKTGRSGLELSADLGVNAEGNLVKAGVKLTSGAWKPTCYVALAVEMFLVASSCSWMLL